MSESGQPATGDTCTCGRPAVGSGLNDRRYCPTCQQRTTHCVCDVVDEP